LENRRITLLIDVVAIFIKSKIAMIKEGHKIRKEVVTTAKDEPVDIQFYAIIGDGQYGVYSTVNSIQFIDPPKVIF